MEYIWNISSDMDEFEDRTLIDGTDVDAFFDVQYIFIYTCA